MPRGPMNPYTTSVADGRKVTVTAGTRVALSATSVPVISVDVTAETNNTGVVVVGGVTCVEAVATRRGTPLNAGDTKTYLNVDLKDVYIDAAVDTDGVTFDYVGAP